MKNLKMGLFCLNIQYLLIGYHLQAALSKELLIQEEFQNPQITPQDVSGWLVNNITTCQQSNFLEYNGQVFGVFSNETPSNNKTYSNLPPHWSALVRLDLMLYGCVNSQLGDIVGITIDSNSIQEYQKYYTEGSPICSNNTQQGRNCQDIVFPYQKNVTHTASQLKIVIDSKFFGEINKVNYKGYAFKHVSIFIDTCYDTCQICNGPSPKNCSSCIQNANFIDGVCTCANQFFAHKFQCVQTCPDGFIGNDATKICEQSKCQNSCKSCVNQSCTICNTPYKLMNGECFLQCPNYSSQKGDSCVDKISNFNYGGYILKGLYSSVFGDSEIQGQGLTLLNNGGATFSSCSGERYLGGWNIAGKDSQIRFESQITKPHWSIRIGFKYIMIDKWQSNEFIQIILNDMQILSNITKDSGSSSGGNICGNSTADSIGIYDITIAQTYSRFSIIINSTIQDSKLVETSFGIREMYILVYYCQEGCLECDQTGCTKCSQGTYLYQHNCQLNCPTDLGYWANSQTNTCDSCQGNCLTCNGSGIFLIYQIRQNFYQFIFLSLQQLHVLSAKQIHIYLIKRAQKLVQINIFQIKIHQYVISVIRAVKHANTQMMKMNALLAKVFYIQMVLNVQINVLIKRIQKQMEINVNLAILLVQNVLDSFKTNVQDALRVIFFIKENAQNNAQQAHIHKKCENLDNKSINQLLSKIILLSFLNLQTF
ncbi:hypothetical protein TTHERM_00019650 (macronuclear) [Tetrahymena thermophila SB210]|uniref:Zinc finger lsd1 subclass family protein n=1 Tax=Tetrahymena thermophila (strain SB210) TaxID=312017 RepID=Q22RC0_TETTS|nr:hypothetical protein TTHERM_00019650 [Tetrahymena thermophila SB210]EAR88202.2 hypothetical protein TTHERM_00019650 [Tetrahymena thermophila SB210]|eukprot:XP_001008447.2 hypothetical protein TTHERM_00019650 [Tetrahymena thermophila SB210]